MMRTKITVWVFAFGLLASWSLAFRSPVARSRSEHESATREATRAVQTRRSEHSAAERPVESPLPPEVLAPVQELARSPKLDRAPHDLAGREHRRLAQLYAGQSPDNAWTERMHRDLAERGGAILGGNLRVDDLSCHQDVCRMYFELERKDDIDVFVPSAFEPDQQYSYRALDEGESGEQSTFMYEVLVARSHPGHRTH